MRRIKKLVAFIAIVIFFCLVLINVKDNNKVNINRILNKDEYSYLSSEAKEYIKNVYNDTGEVVLTEKNKQSGVPYLNPEYADYLSLSVEEQKQTELIPDVYLVDIVENDIYNDSFPSSYDLRNVNGKNFLTPMKDQGSLGICWAFSTVEQAESYLLLKNNTSYNSSSSVFSARQMDFAISSDGIKNYDNSDNMYRSLSSGGNFLMSSLAVANGISLVSDTIFPFNESNDARKLKDVLNYNNSLYEANSSIYINGLTTSSTSNEKETYINTIKNGVVNYGGAWVGTKSPQSSCSTLNTNNTYVIDVDSSCQASASSQGGHAMQIVGWDDNYSYSYCLSGNNHSSLVNGTCPNGTLVNGKGAWLLRNSWGTSSYLRAYQYVYLTYNSLSADIGILTSVTGMNEKTWDNNYHKNPWLDTLYYTNNDTNSYTISLGNEEKIEKVKFFAMSQNANYQVTVSVGKNNYKKNVSVSLPGIVTVDFSDLNIKTSSSFSVNIYSSNNYIFKESISVFTSNVDSVAKIKTEDVDIDVRSSSNDYELVLYSDTKNIPSGQVVSYSLYKNGIDMSSYITVTDNVVAINNINAIIKVNKNIPSGEYELRTSYNNYVYTSSFNVLSNNTIEGLGTQTNPYLIHNQEELLYMSTEPSAYYKLASDIVLSGDMVPIGTISNPFTGSLDGNNYKIKNLKITSNYDYSGLFGYVTTNNNNVLEIKNIIIEEPIIEGSGDVGTLIGHIELLNSSNGVSIDNIRIMSGSISSTTSNTGSLIGLINSSETNNRVSVNNIFTSATIYGTNNVGVIGAVLNKAKVDISYIQNVGMFYVNSNDNSFGTIVGNSVYDENNSNNSSVTISNFINNGLVVNNNNVYGHLINHGLNSINKRNIEKGLYISNNTDLYSYSIDDNKVYSTLDITDFKNKNFADYITDFADNFEIKTIDSIKRIPVLKGVDFEYITISDISVDKNKEVSLLDYITPITSLSRINYSVLENDNIISINDTGNDVIIKGLNTGVAKLHIVSEYDGFEKDVLVTVNPGSVKITFYANNGSSNVVYQNVTSGTFVDLQSNSFSYTGYSFLKWNTKADGKGVSYNNAQNVYLNNDLVLYAIWEPITYYIKFNANGGTGSMSNQNMTYGVYANLYNNSFSRDGYSFLRWNTKADGTGINYNNGASIYNLASINGSVINLYAIWEKDITYIINNYSYDLTNNYIDKIRVNTSMSDYLKNFVLGPGYSISVDNGNSEFIYTGSKTRISHNGNLVVEFSNIVRGDINGDGKISSLDYVKVKNHIMNTKRISGIIFELAADANEDNKISSLDYVRIKNIIMNGGV